VVRSSWFVARPAGRGITINSGIDKHTAGALPYDELREVKKQTQPVRGLSDRVIRQLGDRIAEPRL
jgi:hypothetical protein